MQLSGSFVYISAMRSRSLRALLAILAFLPLQLIGAGHAVACARDGHGASTAMGMPGMGASGSATVASSQPAPEASASAHVRSADDASCNHGVAPGRCMAAPACAPVVFALSRDEREGAVAAQPDGMEPLTVLAPASVTHPPDLRPPRA